MDMLTATILLGALALLGTTAFHYEAIAFLDSRLRRRKGSMRGVVPLAVAIIMAAHLAEVGFYAGLFWLAAGPLELGSLIGLKAHGFVDYFYFAAEGYSSFGYGDIVPTRELRLMASVEPLNGLLLLAWSGAFLYGAVHQRPNGRPSA